MSRWGAPWGAVYDAVKGNRYAFYDENRVWICLSGVFS